MKKQASDNNGPLLIDQLQLREITSRLDALIRLQCALLPEKIGSWDKIRLLSQSGLSSKAIGDILGIRDASVRSALSRSKSKEASKADPVDAGEEESSNAGNLLMTPGQKQTPPET